MKKKASTKKPASKNVKVPVKKVKFDDEDLDTWTIDNIKQVKKYIKDSYGVSLTGKNDKVIIKTAKEVDEKINAYYETLENKKDSVVIKMAEKQGIKLKGRSEKTKAENARDELLGVFIEENWG